MNQNLTSKTDRKGNAIMYYRDYQDRVMRKSYPSSSLRVDYTYDAAGRLTRYRAGNRYLRRALYMPALVAVRHDPHLQTFYQKLLARHKAKLQALIAVARKMLHAIFGMFHSQSTYDGARLFPATDFLAE